MKKYILCMLSLVLLLHVLIIPAHASIPDTEGSGSLYATMMYKEKPVPGGTLTFYRVAEIDLSDPNRFGYRYVDPFGECQVSLANETLFHPDTAAKLAAYAKDKKLTGTTGDIDKEGKVHFTDLETGLYLLVQEKAPSGYAKLAPFLASIPVWDGTEYLYDVDASPKLQLKLAPPSPSVSYPPTLPQTGLLNWPVPLLAAGGVLLVLLGVVLCVLGRKRQGDA